MPTPVIGGVGLIEDLEIMLKGLKMQEGCRYVFGRRYIMVTLDLSVLYQVNNIK